jgi:hypothetical protein
VPIWPGAHPPWGWAARSGWLAAQGSTARRRPSSGGGGGPAGRRCWDNDDWGGRGRGRLRQGEGRLAAAAGAAAGVGREGREKWRTNLALILCGKP